MEKDLWLPSRFVIPGTDYQLSRYEQAGKKWQIYSTTSGERLLFALPELSDEWRKFNLINESYMTTFHFGADTYCYLASSEENVLSALLPHLEPEDSNDALAFASAMKATRMLVGDASLHDGIYVEEISRILPVWSNESQIDDGIVLGRYLTGGVGISTTSFNRLSELVDWMPSKVLKEIVETAGLSVPKNIGISSKDVHAETDQTEKIAASKESKAVEKTPVKNEKFTLPGRKQLEEFFNDHVIDIVQNQERYKAMGIDFPSAIVLYGSTGCGKTFAVDRLVDYLGWPCYSISSNSIGSPYIHETGKKISEMFNQAMEHAPSVLVIDEMDAFLSERQGGSGGHQHHLEEVAEFLRRIPEAVNKRVLVIGMTNLIDAIDPAIIRRGRFDHLIEVEMPTKQEVETLLSSLLAKLPVEENIMLNVLVESLTGRALSDTAFVVREAARLTAKNGLDRITQEYLESALSQLPNIEVNKKRPIGFI